MYQSVWGFQTYHALSGVLDVRMSNGGAVKGLWASVQLQAVAFAPSNHLPESDCPRRPPLCIVGAIIHR